jgi:Peptidase family M23/Trypsin-like peptidase domain
MINIKQLLTKWFVHLRLARIRGKISIVSTGYKKIFLTIVSVSLSVMIVVLQPLVVIGLQPFEVSAIAKKVTVSIEGFNPGSGVIIGINKSNNNYQVMTAWHVIEEKGKYLIRTFDDKIYSFDINTIQRMPNIDLAIVEFTSKTPYPVANIGDSNKLTEGGNVFVSGYPTNGPFNLGRIYKFLPANIDTLLKKMSKDGYSLGYDNFSINGMSGGPVWNKDGELVAIHCATEIRTLTGASGNYGIASETFRNWQQQIALISQKNTPSNSEVLIDKPLVSQQEELVIRSNIKFIWPTVGTLTSRFGRRWGKKHNGIDIVNSIGTPIYAAADGVVQSAEWNSGGYGNLVIIRHVNGILTYYAHNSRLSVEVGKYVSQGEIIALMGSTGSSITPHLHFEIRPPYPNPDIDSVPYTINPLLLLPTN